MKTCILVANASQAELYLCKNLRTSPLETVLKLTHDESRKRENASMTNTRANSSAHLGLRGAGEKMDTKMIEAEHFARLLIQEIQQIKTKNPDCEKLIICSSPHFEGLIKKHAAHTSSPKENLTFKETIFITKDYTGLTSEKLESALKESLNL